MINKEQLNLAPKQFCDSSLMGYHKEYFVLILGSGELVNGFTFSPALFKMLKNSFCITLEQFEKIHGEIKIGDQPVVSPIQMDNLGGGLEDGDKIN